MAAVAVDHQMLHRCVGALSQRLTGHADYARSRTAQLSCVMRD
jgi:hypothetical protein